MPNYPLILPADPQPREVTWRPVNRVAVSESPFTGQSQVYAHPGQWWELSFELPPIPESKAWLWESHLIRLYGREGTFRFGPTTKTPRSTWTGATTVESKFSDSYIRLQGGSGFVSPGDWLEIAGGLYRIVVGGIFNGSGELFVELWPRPRSGVVAGAAVNYTSPKGTFRLTSDFDLSLDVAKINAGLNISAREVV